MICLNEQYLTVVIKNDCMLTGDSVWRDEFAWGFVVIGRGEHINRQFLLQVRITLVDACDSLDG